LPRTAINRTVAGFDIGQVVNRETLQHALGEAAESLCELKHGVAVVPVDEDQRPAVSLSGRKSSLSDTSRFRS